MWSLTITSPKSEPLQIKLVPGRMMIGRLKTCDILIDDPVASRRHADIYYDPLPELVTIKDLKSVNGTYVNRHRVTDLMRLQDGDVIRIGQTVMHLARIPDSASAHKDITGTQLFSRDMVLEAVDEHPIILNEITEKLNPVVDINEAIHVLIGSITRAMGVDLCEIILASDFENSMVNAADSLIARSIHNASVETTPQEICLPVMDDGKPLALIHLGKNRPGAIPFAKRDVQLAVAISNQAALTLQRIRLIDAVRLETQEKQHLLRFIAPVEANELLKDYWKTGILPEPVERKVTVLYIEIIDPGNPEAHNDPGFHAAVLQPFFQVGIQAVLRRDGMARYHGTGLLGIFLDIPGYAVAEERAVGVAREIIQYVKHDAPFGIDQVGVAGAAVHTGSTLAGYAGTREWIQFHIGGDLVQRTIHMQAEAFPNRLLVGASTEEVIRRKVVVQEAGSLVLRADQPPEKFFEVPLLKTAPFGGKAKDDHMAAAFRSVAEKLRSRGKKDAED